MASAITHAVAALSVGGWFYRPEVRRGIWLAAIGGAILPDADVIGFQFGIPYDSVFGHRGITHSMVFAAALAALLAWGIPRGRATGLRPAALGLFFFLATTSHGVLDAFTNGGLGVAFFAPFWNARFFFPVTPIEVSPLSIGGFLNARGLHILANEAAWVWLPAALFGATGLAIGLPSRLKGPGRAG